MVREAERAHPGSGARVLLIPRWQILNMKSSAFMRLRARKYLTGPRVKQEGSWIELASFTRVEPPNHRRCSPWSGHGSASVSASDRSSSSLPGARTLLRMGRCRADSRSEQENALLRRVLEVRDIQAGRGQVQSREKRATGRRRQVNQRQGGPPRRRVTPGGCAARVPHCEPA